MGTFWDILLAVICICGLAFVDDDERGGDQISHHRRRKGQPGGQAQHWGHYEKRKN